MLAEHVNRPQFNYVVSSHVPNSVDRSPGVQQLQLENTTHVVEYCSVPFVTTPAGLLQAELCVVLGLGLKVVPLQV